MDKACLAIMLAFAIRRKPKWRRIWIKEWLKHREKYTHINLLDEIKITHRDDFRNYFRMTENLFDKLLELVTPHIQKCDTSMRNSISAKQRLAVTLRYLATGRSFEDLKFSVLMSPMSISHIILETCQALIYVLKEYIKIPSNCEEWKGIAKDSHQKCNFPTCLGALDGKHIAIRKPDNSTSLYFNYKGYYSIVLMALVNANREFIMVDVGANGKVSDGGVLFYTEFWALFQQNKLDIPSSIRLTNSGELFPFVFVGDEAFALNTNLMKPYSQKNCSNEQQVFNKRLSGARCVVENAFGILAARFGVFQKPICIGPKKATIITLACCYLHNFLIKESPTLYVPQNNENELHVLGLDLRRNPIRNCQLDAKAVRDLYCRYFNRDCET